MDGFRAAWLALFALGCSTPGGLEPSQEESRDDAVTPATTRAPLALSKELAARLPERANGAIELTSPTRDAAVEVRLVGARDIASEPDAPGEARSALPSTLEGRRYRDALGPGWDLRLKASGHGVEDYVTALGPTTLRYEVTLSHGIAGLRRTRDVVEFVDAAGTPVFRAANAAAIGADGERRRLPLRVEGCAVDEDRRPPWGRTPVAPGSDHCDVVLELPEDIAYPAEIDPVWSATDDMTDERYDFEAAPLPGGQAIVLGGRGFGYLDGIEVFDAMSKTWSPAGITLNVPANYFQLTTLDDGKLLVTGGHYAPPGPVNESTSNRVFILNPQIMDLAEVAPMAEAREVHTATRLPGNRVIVAGGQPDGSLITLGSSEIYDADTNTWTPGPDLNTARYDARAVDIGSGRVLLVGGLSNATSAIYKSEVYDDVAGSWGDEIGTANPRWGHTLTRLGDDRVLLVGGYATTQLSPTTEIYDIVAGTWNTINTPGIPLRVEAAAVAGPLGGVLVSAGCTYNDGECGDAIHLPLGDIIWFDPSGGPPVPFDSLPVRRGRHSMVALDNGSFLLMGGENSLALPEKDSYLFEPYQPGEPCEYNFLCNGGHCVDGFCCDTACDGECQACTAALTGGADGTCAAVTDGSDPDGDCSDDGSPSCQHNGACNAGACDSYSGPECTPSTCTDDAECTSGHCVEGICCNEACDAGCKSCRKANTDGAEGVCALVRAGTDPKDACMDGTGTSCGDVLLCDALGDCKVGTDLCAAYSCNAEGCFDDCNADDACSDGFVCIAKACVDEALLCDGSDALQADGTTKSCAPYVCKGRGECPSSCSSVDDCAKGFVCDEQARCVSTPPTSGGDDGCACALAPSDRDAEGRTHGAQVIALGLVAWLRNKRRRAARLARATR